MQRVCPNLTFAVFGIPARPENFACAFVRGVVLSRLVGAIQRDNRFTTPNRHPMFNPVRIVNAQQMSRVSKATVQKTGRLGFSSSATKMLGLSTEKSVIIFEDDKNHDLYLVVVDGQDERAFYVRSVGEYFYIYIKILLDQRHVDYKNKHVSYEITQLDGEEYEGHPVYRMEYIERPIGARDVEEGVDAAGAEDSSASAPQP